MKSHNDIVKDFNKLVAVVAITARECENHMKYGSCDVCRKKRGDHIA